MWAFKEARGILSIFVLRVESLICPCSWLKSNWSTFSRWRMICCEISLWVGIEGGEVCQNRPLGRHITATGREIAFFVSSTGLLLLHLMGHKA